MDNISTFFLIIGIYIYIIARILRADIPFWIIILIDKHQHNIYILKTLRKNNKSYYFKYLFLFIFNRKKFNNFSNNLRKGMSVKASDNLISKTK